MRPSMPIALLFLLLLACDGDIARTDSRFATPERTIDTLLASYGLETSTQEEIRARMAAQERFTIADGAAFRACFADAGDPVSEGLAGWVLGAIAAGRDQLRVEIFGDRAIVAPREGVRIAMLRESDGAWRISLRESVPEEIRRALSGLAERHDRRARARGLPVE